MSMIADVLLVAGALGAALYCLVLSRRLRRFTDLEKGVGGAVAVLSVQVDDLTAILTKAQTTAKASVAQLDAVSERAELAHKRLELSIASMHDLPQKVQPNVTQSPFFVRRQTGDVAKQ
ncbi:hypothetical protein [Yoonia sp.]|uniref:hypothetical protein n=1 Tax=Yoonia sp. TaxID=2212373 RepID=UPI002E0B141F|nr:hypothetical protein [Yoonia sp.]